jgi:tRNA G37 N-methylase Trm5/tRNA(Phe) wybutosine-synthesizing methylase Tyw3
MWETKMMPKATRLQNDFQNSKNQCLGKRDKSYAGRIDPHAVDVCGLINERQDMYTTSSCSGRCFLYKGLGIKSTSTFQRFRISHDLVQDPIRYFDLSTLNEDPTGGGDPIRTIGQYDWKMKTGDGGDEREESEKEEEWQPTEEVSEQQKERGGENGEDDGVIWLRYEPFILHVACRSLEVASQLMSAARPTFKNVGLTTWKTHRLYYLVAIWGDEGLEMPLSTPTTSLSLSSSTTTTPHPLFTSSQHKQWLGKLVNERHERNWAKIQRFCENIRDMRSLSDDDDIDGDNNNFDFDDYGKETLVDSNSKPVTGSSAFSTNCTPRTIPRSYDVIGDIAYLHSLPESSSGASSSGAPSMTYANAIGTAIMKRSKSIKVVVARTSTMEGTQRAPGDDGITIIAGAQRSPLITTHTEYGIRCVVDLNHTFFTPRMAQERLRICQQVARGEHVLVCFAGVGMEANQIAGRTEASKIVAVELNPVAVECARRSHRMLERNKAVKCPGAADRLEIIEGDVLQVLPELESQNGPGSFDRILAPRPKEGKLDGDLGIGDGGRTFLIEIVKNLKPTGGECHWYDFVADHEYPSCDRTTRLIECVCHEQGLNVEIIHVARVGSVATRQLRVCVDFRLK